MRSTNEKKMFEMLLDEIEDTLQDIEQRCLKLESADPAKELQIIFRAAHNVKGAAQLYGLNDFSSLVHAFEDLLTTLQETKLMVNAHTVDILLTAQSSLRSWIQGLRENENYLPDTGDVKELLKQHNEDLKSSMPQERNSDQTTEAVPATASSSKAQPTETESSLVHPSEKVPVKQTEPAAKHSKWTKRNSGTLRIPSQKIDEIMQLIGELSIHQGILWHNYQLGSLNMLNCKNAVVLNQKTLKNLYEIIITLRMQSAEALFQRVERTARDIARDQKKTIAIELVGAETPLDKTVIELITDPMMHLVRNAIDHGIEDDETRLKLGKKVPAQLSIHTKLDTGHVQLSISDDGRGLDPAMILEKAVKRGLIPAGSKIKEEEIYQLIFLPGFSTRDTITELSGRGVGMDIVQKAIQQLGGHIEIHTKKGTGTTFQISLPANLEIIEGLLIRVGEQTYIVPRQNVSEIFDLADHEIESIGQGGRAIHVRGDLIPIEELSDYISIGKRFDHSAVNDSLNRGETLRAPSNQLALQIILSDRSKLALRIDALIAQQQIVVRPLSDNLANVPGFSGVTILGNGEPTMILSTSAIGECYLRWVRSGDGGLPGLGRTAKTYGESA